MKLRQFDEVGPRIPLDTSKATGAILSEYVTYKQPGGPDPRTVSIGEVADGLCLIIETEGPMIAKRAYDIYLRGCGIRRLGGELKSYSDRQARPVKFT